MLSRRDDLQHFLDHLARILARHGVAKRLFHPVDDVALVLEGLALGVELDVRLLQLCHGNAHLLLDRRQALGSRARLDGGDFDRPLELRNSNGVSGALPVQRRLRLCQLALELGDGARVLGVESPRQLLERAHGLFSGAALRQPGECQGE